MRALDSISAPLGHDDQVDCLSDACALAAMGTYGPPAEADPDAGLTAEQRARRDEEERDRRFRRLLLADMPVLDTSEYDWDKDPCRLKDRPGC